MNNKETKVEISNQFLLDVTYALDNIATLAKELALNVTEIELSENDKLLSVENMPRNIYASELFLLSDYTKLQSKALQEAISEAGGDV